MNRINLFKKSGLLLSLTFFSLIGFCQDEEAIQIIEKHRADQHEKFLDKTKSPLSPEDLKAFKGLKYYPIELKYRIKAKFVKTENADLFKMKTTTDRLPDYRKYGEVHFEIDGTEQMLEVYQSPDIMKMPGYEDHLFIPFTDLTNGEETYDVGRYLELKVPASDEVIVDFNLCYNPYCSYSSKYSCPIPPEPNRLNIAIPAGEKKYKDH